MCVRIMKQIVFCLFRTLQETTAEKKEPISFFPSLLQSYLLLSSLTFIFSILVITARYTITVTNGLSYMVCECANVRLFYTVFSQSEIKFHFISILGFIFRSFFLFSFFTFILFLSFIDLSLSSSFFISYSSFFSSPLLSSSLHLFSLLNSTFLTNDTFLLIIRT